MPKKKRILIVDDDPNSVKLQKGLLEMAGYDIVVAICAEAIVSLAIEKLPDLITMDYQLPKISGEAAVKLLRADEATKDIPVVFVTASAMDDEVKRAASYNCRIITKPINTRTFVQEIEAAFNAPGK